MQALLLGLGTLLIAVAAIVFTAVNWSRMDAAAQGLILLALTGVGAAATVAAGRRSLPTTAEALGVVTVLLALVDLHAFRLSMWTTVDPLNFWAAGLAGLTLGAWFLADGARIRSTRLAAVVIGQVPVLLAVAATGHDGPILAGAAIIQTGVVLFLATRLQQVDELARETAASIAGAVWFGVALSSVVYVWGSGADADDRYVAVVGLSAVVAALAAWLRGEDDGIRPLALVAATLTGLVTVGAVYDITLAGPIGSSLTALVAALVALVGFRVERRWGGPPAVTASLVVLFLGLSLGRGAAALMVLLGDIAGFTQWIDPGTSVMDLVSRQDLIHPGSMAITFAALAVLVAAVAPRIGQTYTMLAGVIVGVSAVVLAPLMLPLSIGGAAAACWVAVALGLVIVAVQTFDTTHARSQQDRLDQANTRWVTVVAATILLAVASGWSVTSTALAITNLAVIALVALGLVLIGRRAGDTALAVVAAGAAVLAGALEAGQVAVSTGATMTTAGALAGLVALVLGTVATLALDPTGREGAIDGATARAAEITGWMIHGYVLFVALLNGDTAMWRLTLAAGTVAAALHAARPARRPMAWLAVAEGLVLIWAELAWAQITAPEPYTLPVAALLLAVGLLAERRSLASGDTAAPSWVTLGPGLVVAMAPTLLVSFEDPGALRPILALAAGVAILVAGAITRRRAPVDIGAASIATLALVYVAPVVGSMPNWVALGTAGIILLAVGATFEQRRRDLEGFRDLYSSLR